MSAHLYWGSVGTGDFDVELNGIAISAQRTFDHMAFGRPYFGGYADVTNIVAAGNGSYTFSEMTIDQAVLDNCWQTRLKPMPAKYKYLLFSNTSWPELKPYAKLI